MWILNLHMRVCSIFVGTHVWIDFIYTHAHIYLESFLEPPIQGFCKVSIYRVIGVVGANQWSMSKGGGMTLSGACFLFFSAWTLERMTKQCWRLWICLSVNGWLLRAARALPQGDWLGLQVFTLDAWIWLGKSAKSFTRIFILIRSERPATAE